MFAFLAYNADASCGCAGHIVELTLAVHRSSCCHILNIGGIGKSLVGNSPPRPELCSCGTRGPQRFRLTGANAGGELLVNKPTLIPIGQESQSILHLGIGGTVVDFSLIVCHPLGREYIKSVKHGLKTIVVRVAAYRICRLYN